MIACETFVGCTSIPHPNFSWLRWCWFLGLSVPNANFSLKFKHTLVQVGQSKQYIHFLNPRRRDKYQYMSSGFGMRCNWGVVGFLGPSAPVTSFNLKAKHTYIQVGQSRQYTHLLNPRWRDKYQHMSSGFDMRCVQGQSEAEICS